MIHIKVADTVLGRYVLELFGSINKDYARAQ